MTIAFRNLFIHESVLLFFFSSSVNISFSSWHFDTFNLIFIRFALFANWLSLFSCYDYRFQWKRIQNGFVETLHRSMFDIIMQIGTVGFSGNFILFHGGFIVASIVPSRVDESKQCLSTKGICFRMQRHTIWMAFMKRTWLIHEGLLCPTIFIEFLKLKMIHKVTNPKIIAFLSFSHQTRVFGAIYDCSIVHKRINRG